MKRVVVTGLGIISPVGNTADQTWDALLAGTNGIGKLTYFDTTDFKVKVAAQLKDFDPLLYMEKSELRKTDPCMQYAAAAASQAVEDSGIQGAVDPTRFGVYIGSGIGGITTTVREAVKMAESGTSRVSPFLVPTMIANMPAGYVSMRHNAQGPTLPVVTACATSTNTLGEAFRTIKHGYADAILAGGTEASIIPTAVAGFTSCMALTTSPDPNCASMPFDLRRSGFVMGEGAAVLVLEEYEHAKARGAKIYAEISGYGNTADAYHITAPHPEADGITRAIQNALAESGRKADANTYINAHGTSTPLNDKIETLGFKKALGEEAHNVVISSTKSMTGHLLGAAGALEAFACIKTLQNGICHPTIGYQEPDPECDLNYSPNQPTARPFHTAISTNLGFGGHNACIVFNSL